MKSGNFFAELKRRNVYKVAVAYAVVGWVIAQIATQIFPFFEIPNWAVRLVVLLLTVGFPIALIIAWAFELTPQGIKRTEDVDPGAATRQPRKHAWIVAKSIRGAFIPPGLPEGAATVQTGPFGSQISRSRATHWIGPLTDPRSQNFGKKSRREERQLRRVEAVQSL